MPITSLRAVPRSATASAAAGECDSDVSINYGNGAFSGKVSSKSAKCKRGRTVEVEKVSGKNEEVGEKTTNRRGKYKISYSKNKAEGETFEVHVFKERRGGVRCSGATDKIKP